LSTTNPTWTDPVSNPDLCSGRPATNRLSHGTALFRVTFNLKLETILLLNLSNIPPYYMT
jgi:hypothetical protein